MLKRLVTWLPPVRRLRERRDTLEREVAALTARVKTLEAERSGQPPHPSAVTPAVEHRPPPVPRNFRTYPALTPEQVADYRRRIDEYNDTARSGSRWYFTMDLGNGLKTDGVCSEHDLRTRLDELRIPPDLTGLSFLDIASWDGFHAFEAEARGAARVLATDYFCWRGNGWGKKDGFLLAREVLRSKVEDQEIEVQDISPETVGLFDVVLFSGIFYHMRDPLKALRAAASVTRKMLIVETHVGLQGVSEPVMGYLARVKENPDSNYWRPNPPMIRLLLQELGFTHLEERLHWQEPPLNSMGFWNASRG